MEPTTTKEEAMKRLKEIHDYYSKGILVVSNEEYDSFLAMLGERDDLKKRFNLDNKGNEL